MTRYYNDTHLNAQQFDQRMLELRRRGYSYRQISKAMGGDISPSGVVFALRRIAEGRPGRAPR